jgi:hypothetical protein
MCAYLNLYLKHGLYFGLVEKIIAVNVVQLKERFGIKIGALEVVLFLPHFLQLIFTARMVDSLVMFTLFG